jgi:hypothetical protein
LEYNILNLADLHFGAIDANKEFADLDMILYALQHLHIDMVTIDGDYFDYKLPLNSTAAINAVQWMYTLINQCIKNGVNRIRIFKGTEDHDNDQLEVFRSLEDSDDYFRIFTHNTLEETLPELKCIYCPDENISTDDYLLKYITNITQRPDIGFFHGSFDTVLPDIVLQMSEETSAKNVIFAYDFWSRMINGPLIAGHFHNGKTYDDLIYIGSFERWAFGEEEEKGIGFVHYNTEDHSYYYKKIPNLRADIFKTFKINTMLYQTLDQYSQLMKEIDSVLTENDNIKIRVLITIDDDKDSNDAFIATLRRYYIKNDNIKITIKNMIKEKKKEDKSLKYNEIKQKYSFITDKSLPIEKKFHDYILLTTKHDIPLETIKSILNKYAK